MSADVPAVPTPPAVSSSPTVSSPTASSRTSLSSPTGGAGDVALVTGGTRGIGLGIVEALLREGWAVATCGRRPRDEVRPLLERLRADGARVHYVPADIAEDADREQLLAEVKAELGPMRLLVNNAGVAPRERRDLLEATRDSYDRVMSTNLAGPYFLTQAVARDLVARCEHVPDARAAIVFITSVSATLASPERGEYCLSKAGLAMAAQLWAVRLSGYGIPVYEVRPGVIRTDMTSGVVERYDRLIADGLIPQGRWGLPEDVGRVVAALARGDLAYSTGQVVMVDGGLSLGRL